MSQFTEENEQAEVERIIDACAYELLDRDLEIVSVKREICEAVYKAIDAINYHRQKAYERKRAEWLAKIHQSWKTPEK